MLLNGNSTFPNKKNVNIKCLHDLELTVLCAYCSNINIKIMHWDVFSILSPGLKAHD